MHSRGRLEKRPLTSSDAICVGICGVRWETQMTQWVEAGHFFFSWLSALHFWPRPSLTLCLAAVVQTRLSALSEFWMLSRHSGCVAMVKRPQWCHSLRPLETEPHPPDISLSLCVFVCVSMWNGPVKITPCYPWNTCLCVSAYNELSSCSLRGFLETHHYIQLHIHTPHTHARRYIAFLSTFHHNNQIL